MITSFMMQSMERGKDETLKNFKISVIDDSDLLLQTDQDEGTHLAIVEDLLPLEYGFNSYRVKDLVWSYLKLMILAFEVSFSFFGYDLLDMLGFFVTAHSASPVEEGAFGLSIFFNTVLVFGMFYAVVEKLEMSSAFYYGEGKYKQCLATYWHGIVSVALLSLVYFTPLVAFSRQFFELIGIESEQAALCSYFIKICFPLNLFRMFNEITLCHVLAQGVQRNFGVISAGNIALSAVIGLVTFYAFDIGIWSWWICRAIHEVIVFLMIAPAYLYDINQHTRGWLSIKEIAKGYKEFVYECGYFAINLYTECVGLQIAIYFTGLTHDPSQISAHTALMNIVVLIFDIGMAFATIGSARINILLGMGYTKAAKNFFKLYLAGAVATALIISGITLMLQPVFIWLYGGESEAVADLLSKLLWIYGLMLPADLILYLVFTVCRIADQLILSTSLNICLQIVACSAIYYYLVAGANKTCIEIVITMYLSIYLIQFIVISKLFMMDWSNLKGEEVD